jgi:hypothetical protein
MEVERGLRGHIYAIAGISEDPGFEIGSALGRMTNSYLVRN